MNECKLSLSKLNVGNLLLFCPPKKITLIIQRLNYDLCSLPSSIQCYCKLILFPLPELAALAQLVPHLVLIMLGE